MGKKLIRVVLFLLPVLTALFFLSGSDADAKQVRKTISAERGYRVSGEAPLAKDEQKAYYVEDINRLSEMYVKLFYSFGRATGYIVLMQEGSSFAVIDNVDIKIVMKHDSFIGGDKTVFFTVHRGDFRKLTLMNGEQVIGFPVRSIGLGEVPKGSVIGVHAECWSLFSDMKLYISE